MTDRQCNLRHARLQLLTLFAMAAALILVATMVDTEVFRDSEIFTTISLFAGLSLARYLKLRKQGGLELIGDEKLFCHTSSLPGIWTRPGI